MIAFLIIVGLGLAASLFVSHLAYALAERWQSDRAEKRDPIRDRLIRDARYAKLL